jgi:hypothetical protein
MSAFFDGAAVRNRSFAEILDDVASTQDEAAAPSRMRSFADTAGPDWLFTMLNRAASAPAKGSEAAFFDDGGAGAAVEDDIAADPVAAEPVCFDLDEDKIAAELGLASAHTVAELKRARRIFARRYHPDLFAPALRPLATARMQLANMLLDKKRRELEGRY